MSTPDLKTLSDDVYNTITDADDWALKISELLDRIDDADEQALAKIDNHCEFLTSVVRDGVTVVCIAAV